MSNLLIADQMLAPGESQEQSLPGSREVAAAHAAPPGTVRWDWSTGERLDEFWGYLPNATTQRLVVVAGMSQMYSINEPQPGDRTISELLDDTLAPAGVRVFGLAAPNLCNEEALFLLLSLLSDEATRPDALIYGACFDKFRNLDLRPGYQNFLRSHPAAQTLISENARTYAQQYPLAADKILKSLQAVQEPPETKVDEALEARVRGIAAQALPMVAARQQLNTAAQMDLFLFRNWLLQITPTSKRPVIQGRYELNKQFLAMMIDIAARKRVAVLCYVIPLNPQSDNPYVPAEYVNFKIWLEGLCREKSVPFANLENVVPSEDWGIFMGGPDFKHFKGAGHRLTAQALLERFGNEIVGTPAAGAKGL